METRALRSGNVAETKLLRPYSIGPNLHIQTDCECGLGFSGKWNRCRAGYLAERVACCARRRCVLLGARSAADAAAAGADGGAGDADADAGGYDSATTGAHDAARRRLTTVV